MDDLKKLSMQRLRALAREHLGTGHSRHRTKAELLAALKDAVKGPLGKLLDAAEALVPGAGRVRVVDFPPGRRGRLREAGSTDEEASAPAPATPAAPRAASPSARAKGSTSTSAPSSATGAATPSRGRRTAAARAAAAPSPAAPPPDEAPPRARPARGTRAPGTKRPAARGGAAAPALAPDAEVGSSASPDVRPAPHVPSSSSPESGPSGEPGDGAPTPTPRPSTPRREPVTAGFFDASPGVRRPRRVPTLPESVVAGIARLPPGAGTEAPVLLVRDPTTLFVFWDFRRELERGAALGLREPRLLLRVHGAGAIARTLELPLDTRSTYVTGLDPGAEYTAEVLVLGRDGWTRPVGRRSAARRLPPGRPSARLEVRTLRLPWTTPLADAPAPSAAAVPRTEPLDSPRRIPLPTSPGARGRSGSGPGAGGGSGGSGQG